MIWGGAFDGFDDAVGGAAGYDAEALADGVCRLVVGGVYGEEKIALFGVFGCGWWGGTNGRHLGRIGARFASLDSRGGCRHMSCGGCRRMSGGGVSTQDGRQL